MKRLLILFLLLMPLAVAQDGSSNQAVGGGGAQKAVTGQQITVVHNGTGILITPVNASNASAKPASFMDTKIFGMNAWILIVAMFGYYWIFMRKKKDGDEEEYGAYVESAKEEPRKTSEEIKVVEGAKEETVEEDGVDVDKYFNEDKYDKVI